jgi:hypothetical protein
MDDGQKQICELHRQGLTVNEIVASLGYEAKVVEWAINNQAHQAESPNDYGTTMGRENKQIDDMAKEGLSAHEIAQRLGYETLQVEQVLAANERIRAERKRRIDSEVPINPEFQCDKDLQEAVDALREVATFGETKRGREAAKQLLRIAGYLK